MYIIGKLMLRNRQKAILNDLKNTNNLITASSIAKKYDISLRTVRNDIEKIDFYCKENNLEFVRVPGVGMRIIYTDTVNKVKKEALVFNSFFEYESKERKTLLALCFLYLSWPIKSEYLCKILDISKGTLLNELKGLNELINKNVKVVGVKNKGYFLEYKEETDLIYLLKNIINQNDSLIIKNTIFSSVNNILDESEIEITNQCVDYISNNMLLFSNEKLSLYSSMALLLKIMKRSNIKDKIKNSDQSVASLASFIEYKVNLQMNNKEYACLNLILNLYTDKYENNLDDNKKLSKAIDALINEMTSLHKELADERDILQVDLSNHIKSQLLAKKLNIENSNELLSDIKTRYYDIFNDTKNSLKSFKKYLNVEFNDDDIGYITLYFCKSLDKIKKIKEAKVMVVCNTGRGASQFLATRIMNNCPEIHIVAMNSYLDIDKDYSILKNIDLIISTIALPDVDVPYVIVSPLLTNLELKKIREACRIGKTTYASSIDNNLNETVDNLVSKYVNYHDAKEFTSKLTYLIDSVNTKPVVEFEEDVARNYTNVSLEIFKYFSNKYPKKINSEQFNVLTALMTHVLMSIPRWQKNDFIYMKDYENLKNEYPQEYDEAKQILDDISKILGIYIDSNEVFTILRYLVLL